MEKDSTTIERKKRRNPTACEICGAPALYSYYNVIACRPCKVFFKRNAESKQNTSKCDLHGQCEINVNNRHTCAACRLQKCFQVGMKIEMIRKSCIHEKTTTTMTTTSNQTEQLTELNLLERDLLSNLINIYDESKFSLMIEGIRNENNSSKILTIKTQFLIEELLEVFYKTAEIYLQSNSDITQLMAGDRTVLLRTAADNITCLGLLFILSHSRLIFEDFFFNHLQVFYGNISMSYHRSSTSFIPSDIILFKLSLALLTVSFNLTTILRDPSMEFSNIKQIWDIENKYAELTWKYLLSKYDYHQAIEKYMKLIEWFLSTTISIYYFQNSPRHVDDVNILIEQTELKLILDDIERINENVN